MPDADALPPITVDVNIDTWLADKARTAVDYYIKNALPERLPDPDKWAVKASQIKGLQQIARQQPERLKDFAEKQLDKATKRAQQGSDEARAREEQVMAFWKLVLELVAGRAAGFGWSLEAARSAAMPQHLRQVPQGKAATREEQEARRMQKEERERWEQMWNAAHVPAFFRMFCIHYLYRMYNSKER